jgi:hypothetical protein
MEMRAMPDSTIQAQAVQQVLEIVDAYIQTFQPPLTQAFLSQIIESALPQIKGIQLNEASIKQHVVKQAIAQFDPLVALHKKIGVDAVNLATKMHQQLRDFRPERGVAEALDVLDAYIQQYRPSLVPASLYPVIKTILPQLKGLRLDQEKLERLTNQAILKFVPELVSTKLLSPKARAIAILVAKQIQNFQPQQVVLDVLGVLDAYIQQSKMSPTEATLYQIAKQVIPQMVKMALNTDETEQFATQVLFQFKKRSGPMRDPNEVAKAIATQLINQVEQIRAIRAQELSLIDLTKPVSAGELEIKSNFVITP